MPGDKKITNTQDNKSFGEVFGERVLNIVHTNIQQMEMDFLVRVEILVLLLVQETK
jgi:hypothetical protein